MQGKKALDVIYDNFFKLKDEQKKVLSKVMAESGIGDRNIDLKTDEQRLKGEIDGAGFIQRLKGVIDRALLKPAFGGDEGQKVKALFNILEANIPKIARGLGHTGVLTELDVMKSFGVAPDITGTMIENKERQRLYNELLLNNVNTLLDSYTPFGDEKIDREKLMKKVGLSGGTNTKEKGTQTIRVKLKATGQTGNLLESDFNPDKYERI
jgi:hypothetical protein